MRIVCLYCFVFLVAAVSYAQVLDEPFQQVQTRFYSFAELGLAPVHSMARSEAERLWLLTDRALFLRDGQNLRRVDDRLRMEIEPGMAIDCAKGAQGATVLAGENRFYLWSPGQRVVARQASFGRVNDVAIDANGNLWFGAESGLWQLLRGRREPQAVAAVQEPIERVAVGGGHVLAVSENKLWLRLEGAWRYEWLDPLMGGKVAALAVHREGSFWLGGAKGLVGMNQAGTLAPMRPEINDRLADVTALEWQRWNGQDTLWMITSQGLAALQPENGAEPLRFFDAHQWNVPETISQLQADADHTLWITSEEGLVELGAVEMRLREKARQLAEKKREWHRRDGLIANALRPESDGAAQAMVGEFDGLRTALDVAALCLHYAAEPDSAIQQRAWQGYEGVKRLEEAASQPALLARTLVQGDVSPPIEGPWRQGAGGGQWLDGLGAAEWMAHFFCRALMHDLVCQSDDERQRIQTDLQAMIDPVIANDFRLLNADGEPTSTGVWAPGSINQDPAWASRRGLHSLQILAALMTAHQITGNQTYRDAFYDLVKNHGYAANTIHQKMIEEPSQPPLDDLGAFVSYYLLDRYNDDALLQPFFERSLRRTLMLNRDPQHAHWMMMALVVDEQAQGLQEVVQALRRSPLEWALAPKTPGWQWRFIEDVPIPGQGGAIMAPPTAWLLTYWLGRYHELIVSPNVSP